MHLSSVTHTAYTDLGKLDCCVAWSSRSSMLSSCVSLYSVFFFCFFFFFQAEDGIRDLIVTGVQTCALPIFNARFSRTAPEPWEFGGTESGFGQTRHAHGRFGGWPGQDRGSTSPAQPKIGRASCRERV